MLLQVSTHCKIKKRTHTFARPARWAPRVSIYSMYFVKSLNSSIVGRNTMICGTADLPADVGWTTSITNLRNTPVKHTGTSGLGRVSHFFSLRESLFYGSWVLAKGQEYFAECGLRNAECRPRAFCGMWDAEKTCGMRYNLRNGKCGKVILQLINFR